MAEKAPSQTVTIDGVKYDAASLSKEARSAINNMALVQKEITELRNRMGIARVAQEVFATQLKAQLPTAKKAK